MYLCDPLQGQHGFTSLEFRKFTIARLELSVHTQLLGYKYTPGVKAKIFSIGYLIDKTAPERSSNFEEFMVGVIKDKPANIDSFYDANVKTLFESVIKLRNYCESMALLAEDQSSLEEIADIKVCYD